MTFDQIVHAWFIQRMAEANAILEEDHKHLYVSTLSKSLSMEMSFKDAISVIMDALPPTCRGYECIRSYKDKETHEVKCVFRKKGS